MKIRFLLLFTLLLYCTAAYAQLGKVTVRITNFSNTDGYARITLFDQGDGFPSDHKSGIEVQSIDLDTTTIYVKFDSLSYGEYAIAVLHDENENQKMDSNIIGIPQEGYGVSNNINPFMRPPNFDEAKFLLEVQDLELEIIMIYR